MIGQRWIEMRNTLAEDMTHANEIAASIINEHLPEVYAINHDYQTFKIETGSQINTSYSLYSRDTVEKLIKERPLLYPQAVINRTIDLPYNQEVVTSAVIQGVLQGEDIYDVKERIMPEVRKKTNLEKFGDVATLTAAEIERKLQISGMRSARTLVTSAQNSGRMDAMRRASELGIKSLKVWIATPDSRVRDSHARLDGEEQPEEKEFSNGCKYPGDPNGAPEEVINCRCTLGAHVKGAKLDLSDLSKRHSGLSRDYIGGEDMTYQEWKDLHSENPDVKNAARERWKETERSYERRQQYYG
jgi:uncharacterized protein with gpF-like domain